MSSSTKKTADKKAALETLTGHAIDATPQQIERLLFTATSPASTYSFTLQSSGEVVSRSILASVTPTCAPSELLDVSGYSETGETGSVTLLIKEFICPSELGRWYGEPVNIVVTPVSPTPIFATVTYTRIIPPSNTLANNIQINIFAWDPTGAPVPFVFVNWRVRVPTLIMI